MTLLYYSESQLLKKIERLPRAHRAIFAAACAERQLPGYAIYSKKTGRGQPESLSDVLVWLWGAIASGQYESRVISRKIDLALQLVPREDDGPWANGTASAEDASASVVYALKCHSSGDSQDAVWAARRAYENLDNYITTEEDGAVSWVSQSKLPADIAQVTSHPLIQAELERQNRDLDDLLGSTDRNANELVKSFRERAIAESQFFFGPLS